MWILDKNARAGPLQTLHDHQYRHAFTSPVYIHPDGEACTLLQIVTAAIKKWAADKEDEAEQCIIQKLSFAYSDILRDASARMRMAQALETQNKLVHTSPTRATRRLQYNKRPSTGMLLFTKNTHKKKHTPNKPRPGANFAFGNDERSQKLATNDGDLHGLSETLGTGSGKNTTGKKTQGCSEILSTKCYKPTSHRRAKHRQGFAPRAYENRTGHTATKYGRCQRESQTKNQVQKNTKSIKNSTISKEQFDRLGTLIGRGKTRWNQLSNRAKTEAKSLGLKEDNFPQ